MKTLSIILLAVISIILIFKAIYVAVNTASRSHNIKKEIDNANLCIVLCIIEIALCGLETIIYIKLGSQIVIMGILAFLNIIELIANILERRIYKKELEAKV